MIKLLENTRRPDITFCRNGTIRITANVARALSLRPGDSINIAVSNGEYLLYAIHPSNKIGRHEARCYPTKKGGYNYGAKSVRLCRTFLDKLGFSGESASYMVGEAIEISNTIYVPIITLRPL